MELQELIARGRFIFARAPERLKIFELVNGRYSAKEIAKRVKRNHSNTLKDLQRLKDMELIRVKVDAAGTVVKKNDSSMVYEKMPLARQIPAIYFHGGLTSHRQAIQAGRRSVPSTVKDKRPKALLIPNETDILDLCKTGEDDISEFKGPGTETRKVTKEIAAFLHTRQGGIVYYGVQDDGTISGADVPKQKLDQQLQNSVRNAIKPAPHIQIAEKTVLGTKIDLIHIPPWDRKTVYFYEGRVYIRKGTNVFEASPEEIKRLHKGEYIA